jgi:hypothetical protein
MLNKLFENEAVTLPAHLQVGTKEYHILHVLRSVLEAELLTVELNKAMTVNITLQGETYYLSGNRIRPWDQSEWNYRFIAFARGDKEKESFVVYNLSSDKMLYTLTNDKPSLSKLMTAV